MQKFKLYLLAALATVLLLATGLSSCSYVLVDKKEVEFKTTQAIERAYFEGQRDALDGDVRIKLNKDSSYYWIKSPWNSGKAPIYTPTYLDTRDGN